MFRGGNLEHWLTSVAIVADLVGMVEAGRETRSEESVPPCLTFKQVAAGRLAPRPALVLLLVCRREDNWNPSWKFGRWTHVILDLVIQAQLASLTETEVVGNGRGNGRVGGASPVLDASSTHLSASTKQSEGR